MPATTYATVQDVQARMAHTLTLSEQTLCSTLLEDAAVMIDNYNKNATAAAKKIVSCRMVSRAVQANDEFVPVGASQGSMTSGPYTQSWTMSTGGTTGELYLSKADKDLLGGHGNQIGSYSPTQELAPQPPAPDPI